MMYGNLLIISVVLILQVFCSKYFFPIYPEQIHLSFGNSPEEMVVTWVTFADTKVSFVWFGKVTDGLTQRAEGCLRRYAVRKTSRRVRFIHKVVLNNLEPCTFYAYRCGSWYGASDPYVFKTAPVGTEWSPRLIIYGDMGWKGAATFPYILEDAQDYDVDAIVHVGDIAYDMASKDGFVGDQFMKMIQPLASVVPYMTAVGNHEQYQNFSHYKNIFSMPGKSQGLYYSFDLGPAHFVIVSTEVYYFTQYGVEPIKRQYEWLEKDLRKAAKNRHERPWIIVFGHRPMYCSSDEGEDCSLDKSLLRCCSLNSCNYGLEDLFHKYRVDLIFSGHMHYYERSWPIYKQSVYNGSCIQPYKNPGAAVHIITGAAFRVVVQVFWWCVLYSCVAIVQKVHEKYPVQLEVEYSDNMVRVNPVKTLKFLCNTSIVTCSLPTNGGMKSGTETATYVRRDLFGFFSSEYSYTVLRIFNKTFSYLEQISATRFGQVIDAVYFIKDP